MLAASSAAIAQTLAIADHLLPWSDERTTLTEQYLAAHRTTPLSGDPEVDTHMIARAVVLHWTGGPTTMSAWNTFAPARLSGRPELTRGGQLNVGAHFLVDRDGRIERIVPWDRVVRHCIGLNHVAIGVENVGGPDLPLTESQVEADAALVRYIAANLPIEYLLGHQESPRMEQTPLFEERDPGYRNAKPDPGADFMAKVRAKVADLGLKAPP